MLKPDNPAWAELIADIKSVVAGRYAEDLDAIFGPTYVPSEEEPGFEFGVLKREDRQNVLADMVDWRRCECQGMSHAQQRIVIANVLDGKPQEKWLEGVLDEAVLENDRIAAFKTMVEISRNSPDNHYFEEMDGERQPWAELSAAAKLGYIARDAAISEVPFKAFAEVAKDVIGENMDAALQVLFEHQKERTAIARLLPDDGRTEPTPLVEQVKDMMDHVAELETQKEERQQGGLEGAKSLQDILRGDQPMPQEVKSQERDGRETPGIGMLKPDDPVWAELIADIKAVVSSRCEDGFAFTSLHRTEQWDFFTTSGFYSPYMDRGMTDTQIFRIIRNAIDGKPQENWLEGVFDAGLRTPTFGDILKAVGLEPQKTQAQERGGREM